MRDLGEEEAARRARRPRRLLRARDRRGADRRASSARSSETGAAAGDRRRRRRQPAAARARCAALGVPRPRPAARAVHRQRGDDRLRRALRRAASAFPDYLALDAYADGGVTHRHHALRPARLPPVRRRARRAASACARARRSRSRGATSAPTTRCYRRYLERIPVVALDGEELFDFFVDEAALRRRLALSCGRDELRRRRAPSSDGARRVTRASGRSATASRSASPRACRATCRCSRRRARWARRRSPRRSCPTTRTSTRRRSGATCRASASSASAASATTSTRSSRRSARSCAPAGQHNIALFGAGHLGRAIASSDIFADHGFRVVAIFDSDRGEGRRAGRRRTVRHTDDLNAGRRGGGHRRRRARRPDGRRPAARRRASSTPA